jgi:hypothetical protein
MDYPKEDSKSVYDYSDKSIPHAGYAAIAFAVISLFSGLLAWIHYFLYHRPGTGGFVSHHFVSQQYLQTTPFNTAVAVVFSVIIAAISGVLPFSFFAVVASQWSPRWFSSSCCSFTRGLLLILSRTHLSASSWSVFCCEAPDEYSKIMQSGRWKRKRSNSR